MSIATEESGPFTLLRFNPMRARRGVGAAEVKIDDGDNVLVLWMTERDLKKSIAQFGPDPELSKALAYYSKRFERFP